MATYRVEAWVESAVRSCLEQTFEDFELVIVEDGSDDSTPEILRRIRDPRVRLLWNSENQGTAACRRRALAQVRGTWITPLDADDLYHRDRLRVLLAEAREQGPDTVLVDTYRDFAGPTPPDVRAPLPARPTAEEIPIERWLREDRGGKPFYSRELLRRSGALPSGAVAEDTIFLTRLMRADGARIVHLDVPSYAYRVHRDSQTGRPGRPARLLDELRALEREMADVPSVVEALQVLVQKYEDERWWDRLRSAANGPARLRTIAGLATERPDLVRQLPARLARSRAARRAMR